MHYTKHLTVTFALFALSALPLAASPAHTFYAFGGDSFGYPRDFTAISKTGTSSSEFLLGDGSLFFNGGLAYRESDSTFFAIANGWLGGTFVQFDQNGTSSLTPIATLNAGYSGGLAYDATSGLFYTIQNDNNGNSTLYTLDASGNLTNPLPLGFGFYGGLTFNPDDGLLYAMGGFPYGVQNSLYSFSPTAFAGANQLFTLGNGSVNFGGGLAWDTTSQSFYVIGSDFTAASTLFSFNLSGPASLTPAGSPFGYGFFNAGLVLLEEPINGGGGSGGGGGGGGGGDPTPVPEPSTIPALAVGFAALIALRRKLA